MLALNPESALPLHHQLQQALNSEIRAGRWQPGQMIASERELMKLTGVSRATVRQAINALIQQGVLTSVQGRGTFVAQPRYEQEIRTVYSFSEQMRAQGVQLEDRVLQCVVYPAPPELAALLGIRPKERLIHLQRIRSVRATPFMLSSSYLPYALCPALASEPLAGSLYQMLTEKYDLPPLRSRDTLEAHSADAATAYHLQVMPGTPLIYVERVAYTRNDLPLHVGRNHIRGDMCRFRIDLQSEATSLEFKAPHRL